MFVVSVSYEVNYRVRSITATTALRYFNIETQLLPLQLLYSVQDNILLSIYLISLQAPHDQCRPSITSLASLSGSLCFDNATTQASPNSAG